MYEVETTGDTSKHTTYIGDVAILIESEFDLSIRYTHKDRLGSSATFTDHNGQVTARRHFDPFGKPRGGDWSSLTIANLAGNPDDIDMATRRGFTDHEHIDEAQMIHMNGRIYDYNIGRFMSVDPFIQGSGSQGINPYSYVMNNPLGYTDPTGYIAFDAGACNAANGCTGHAKTMHFIASLQGGPLNPQALKSGALVSSGSNGAVLNASKSGSSGEEGSTIDSGGQGDISKADGISSGTSGDKAAASGCSYEAASTCSSAGRYNRISKDVGLMDGYDIKGLSDTVFVNNDTGFKSALFEDTVDGGYLLAYAGTDSLNDVDDIVGHFFGVETSQHKEAATVAMRVSKAVNRNLSFTGHSLGGALATTATVATGLKSTIFNSQGFNFGSMSQAKISTVNRLITSYKSSRDVLSLFQDYTPFTHNAAGSTRSLGSAGYHGIGAVCKSLGASCSY